MLMRFLIWCGFYQHGDRIVRVKSWLPSWDGNWLGWPTLLIDKRSGRRETSTPCWLCKNNAQRPLTTTEMDSLRRALRRSVRIIHKAE